MVIAAGVPSAGAATFSLRPHVSEPGTIGVRLVEAPTKRRDDPRARLYIVDHVAPGATVHRRVEVSTTTGSPQRVAVYAAEADTRDGAFVVADGRAANELTSWVTTDRTVLDLPPSGRSLVAVTIRVPRRASAGERYGVVWAEVASPPAPGGAVSVVNRVGIRMYLSVGPGGEPASDFRIESLSATRAADGRPMVTAYVRNTGGRALDVTGSLVLADGPGGLSAGPFPAQLGTTLALGDTKPVAVLLDRRLPEGPWRARIALHSGFVKRVSEATLVFPGPGDVALGGSKQRGLKVAVVAGVALPCLLALWLIAHLSRRLRRRRGVG